MRTKRYDHKKCQSLCVQANKRNETQEIGGSFPYRRLEEVESDWTAEHAAELGSVLVGGTQVAGFFVSDPVRPLLKGWCIQWGWRLVPLTSDMDGQMRN